MADCREVSTLPLAPSVIDLLLRSGFRAIDDLKGMKPTELSQECNISVDIALSVLQCVAKSYTTQNSVEDQKDESNVFTARDFVLKAQTEKPIITFCESLDSMLGGGVFIGQITEFCGVPGVGKTQLGIQLCADVQIPECFGGAAGEAVYIDTEGSFMVERAADMADAIAIHVKKLGANMNRNSNSTKEMANLRNQVASNITKEALLERIHVFRAHDVTEQMAIINHLSSFLKLKTKVKIIVIDSIAFHFRQDLQDTTSRSRVLSSVAQTLNQIAHDHSVAVVLINHITTRIDRDLDTGQNISRLIPALGEQWSHCVTNRVMMQYGRDGQREATLIKSPFRPVGTATYRICEQGVRGLLIDKNRKRSITETEKA